MYNLNVSGPGGSNLLSLPQGESSCTTPRTPEILNSLIAMTNPFDSYRATNAPRLASSPPGGSDTTSTSSSGSPSCMSPPSVQHTCSQLIKEGLKLTIQTKRRQTGRCATLEDGTKVPRREEVSRDSLADDDDDDIFSTGDGLTPEDEERRRRRRERNKIAATKCRLKKRERTVNLVQESEILENQNHDLKSQIQELETQRRRLVDMLSVHRPSCTKQQQHFTTTENTTFVSNSFPTTYPRSTTALTMETNSSLYRRVNMSSTYPRASSTSAIDSTMTYRRIEMSSGNAVEPTYQRLETTLEENSNYCRPTNNAGIDTTISYHTFEDEEIKDPNILLVPYGRSSGVSIENPPTFTRINEQYQTNLTNLDNSMSFMKPELSSLTGYQSPSSTFGRPISLDVNTPVSPVYNSNVDGLDSPNIAPNNYQHYDDDNDNSFSAGFSSTGLDRGCIA